jgi:hypothetical protein
VPGGLNLGGAFFTIYGDNEQILRSMAQARAATETATKAMTGAQKAYAAAAQSSNATVIRMNVEVAEQWVRTAQVASGALRDNVAVLDAYGVKLKGFGQASEEAGRKTEGFGQRVKKGAKDADDAGSHLAQYNISLKSIGATLATLTGFGAIASGTVVIRESVIGLTKAAQDLNQEQFRLNKLFGDSAPILARQAAALADLSGRSLTDALAATNTLATAQKNWGISAEQAAFLQKTVANSAAVSGMTLEEVAKRVGPALTGEAEAVEILGFSLQNNYLKALLTTGSEENKQFQRMGPRRQAQTILNELMKQAADQEGAAAERAESAAGATDKMAAAMSNLAAKIGQSLNPEMVMLAKLVVDASNATLKWIEIQREMNAVAAEFAKEKGIPAWLLLLPGVAKTLADIDALLGGVAKKTVEASQAAAQAATDQAAQAQKAINDSNKAVADNAEDAKARIKELEDLQKKATQRSVDAENAAYQDKKDALQADKDAQIKATEAKKDAALEGIRAEKEAGERLYEGRLVALEKQKEAATTAAEARKTAALRALENEKDAVEAASELSQRAIKARSEAEDRASDDRLRSAKAALEREKQARDAARTDEDRALEDQTRRVKRELADRHDAVLKAIEDEARAVRDRAESDLKGVERQAKASERRSQKKLRALDAENAAAERGHDAAMKALDQEGTAAERGHASTLRAISDEVAAAEERHRLTVVSVEAELSAAKERHRLATVDIDAELAAAKQRHELAVRQVADEADAAEAAHDRIVRSISEEVDAATARHEVTVRGLEAEMATAERAHDAEMARIEDLKQAEDDRHRDRLAGIEEEQRRQDALIDAQLGLLDELDRREAGANKLDDLQSALQKALSTGNQSEIAAAERAIAEEQTKQQRDALRDQLKARKDAVKDATDLAKGRADAEHDQAEREIADAKDVADAVLKAVKDGVDARKQAADDELQQIKDGADARKQAADDELRAVKAVLDGRKQAADDALDRISAELAARKDAADEEVRLAQVAADARKDAADEALRLVKDDADARKTAADDELQRVKDGLAAKKAALDDEKTKRQEVYDDEKQKLADREQREKDALDKRKTRIADERDAALKALGEKKDREEQDNQDAERRQEDALTETKRTIADRRTAEDQAAQEAAKEVEEAHRLEQQHIADTRDAAIQASKDALAAYHTDYDQRKLVVEDQYKAEQAQIKATFDDPETGLIPRLKQAYELTKENYDKRTLEVNAQYKNERDQIEDTFDNKDHGLFKKLEDVHQATIDGLKNVEEDWQKGFADPIKKITDQTFSDIDAAFARLLKGHKVEGGDGGDGDKHGGDGGDGGGGKGGRVAGGGYRPVVDDATDNSYWTSGGTHGGHPAADIFAPKGSNIHAPVGGTSHPARYSAGGNATTLKGDDGRWYYFAHGNDSFKGGRVDAGEVIGHVGNTGNAASTSPHLHLAIASDPDLFGEWNGSGDITGDSSYWTGEGGSGDGGGDDDDRDLGAGMKMEDGYLVFTLFGRRYRIKMPSSHLKGSALLRAIEQLGESIGGREFGRAAAAVADSEGADGDLSRAGSGGARGPYQFDPGGELRNYADYLGVSMDEAGTHAGLVPLDAARYALSGGRSSAGFSGEGYLGRAIKAGLKEDLEGPDLAVYASRYGQRPRAGLEERAGESYRKLYGYAQGGPIPEPTLLVGRTLGPYAMAGEASPEWVTPNAPAVGNGGPLQRAEMPIILGNREVERIWITGYQLNVQRGRVMLPAHRRTV